MDGLITQLRYKFFYGNKIKMVNPDEEKLRGKEVFLFVRELALYNVKLSRLINSNQKESSRTVALNIAYYIVENNEIYESFNKKRELPISKIYRGTGASRAFIELWGDFIIAYTLILANPNYKFIQEYLNVTEYSKEGIAVANKGNNSYKGIVLKKLKKSAFLLTSTGSFVKIKLNEDSKIGEEKEGFEKKGIKNYKKHIAVSLIIIITLVSIFYYKYNKITSIIVINTTSQIKLEINSFNKVVYSYSPTEKGSKLLDTANVENHDIDNSLRKVIELAKDNNMIIENSVTIFINGEAIVYDKLEKTEEYLIENKIDASINNVGYEHKIRKGKYENESGENKE